MAPANASKGPSATVLHLAAFNHLGKESGPQLVGFAPGGVSTLCASISPTHIPTHCHPPIGVPTRHGIFTTIHSESRPLFAHPSTASDQPPPHALPPIRVPPLPTLFHSRQQSSIITLIYLDSLPSAGSPFFMMGTLPTEVSGHCHSSTRCSPNILSQISSP